MQYVEDSLYTQPKEPASGVGYPQSLTFVDVIKIDSRTMEVVDFRTLPTTTEEKQ